MDQAGFFVEEGENLSDESGLSLFWGFDILQKEMEIISIQAEIPVTERST